MSPLAFICQLVIALGIYNVWLLRINKPTAWRGGEAKTMEEEFKVYGLSPSFMKIVGACKLFFATCLLLGIWYPKCASVAALVMASLMLAAVLMHARVRDPVRKALPAASLLLLSLVVLFTS